LTPVNKTNIKMKNTILVTLSIILFACSCRPAESTATETEVIRDTPTLPALSLSESEIMERITNPIGWICSYSEQEGSLLSILYLLFNRDNNEFLMFDPELHKNEATEDGLIQLVVDGIGSYYIRSPHGLDLYYDEPNKVEKHYRIISLSEEELHLISLEDGGNNKCIPYTPYLTPPCVYWRWANNHISEKTCVWGQVDNVIVDSEYSYFMFSNGTDNFFVISPISPRINEEIIGLCVKIQGEIKYAESENQIYMELLNENQFEYCR